MSASNYYTSTVFLSDVLGKKRGAGHDACDQLVQYAIPAARKAGIRVVWVNWGLTEQEIEEMPPAVLRAFGFEGQRGGEKVPIDKHGNVGGSKGMGREMGVFKDPNSGKEVDAGKLLMRDQWNSALLPPLDKMYQEGAKLKNKPDVWIHKNRMSGIWTNTALSEFLARENLKTVLFTGVNTDQCVAGTYMDCFSKGYVRNFDRVPPSSTNLLINRGRFDSILLNDGCGTTSPDFAQKEVEFNAAHTWGFETKCKAFAEAVDKMET